MNDLELQRKSLPNEPGIYLFKNSESKIIYVGKAINLKKRVSSYFLKTSYNDPYYEEKIKDMVEQIHSIEYISRFLTGVGRLGLLLSCFCISFGSFIILFGNHQFMGIKLNITEEDIEGFLKSAYCKTEGPYKPEINPGIYEVLGDEIIYTSYVLWRGKGKLI